MKIYTNTGTRKVREQCVDLDVGFMMVRWHNPDKWSYYAIDNGAFSSYTKGVEWNPTPFLHSVYMARQHHFKPDFIILPDIVGGGDESLERSLAWLSVLPPDMPYYLAVQDGMTSSKVEDAIHDPRITGIFVGGSTPWKLTNAPIYSDMARRYGKRCHVGRVSAYDKAVQMHDVGVSSIDSTTWVQCKRMDVLTRIRESIPLTEDDLNDTPGEVIKIRKTLMDFI